MYNNHINNNNNNKNAIKTKIEMKRKNESNPEHSIFAWEAKNEGAINSVLSAEV